MNPQSFSQDVILPKLVEYFNSLDAAARTISSSDLPLFKISVVKDGSGQEQVVVGDIAVAEEKYIGDATYTWIGQRGIAVFATTADFFEISRYVHTVPTDTPPPASGSGLTEIKIRERDGFSDSQQDAIYAEVGADSSDPDSLAIVYSPRMLGTAEDAEQQDTIWFRLPTSSGDNLGLNQMVRMRPLFVNKQREVRVTVDGSNPDFPIYGEYTELVGAIFDAETQVQVRVNPQTLRLPAAANGGGFTITLQATETYGRGMNVQPVVQLNYDYPGSPQSYLRPITMDYTILPDTGLFKWVAESDMSPVPGDLYAELIVTIRYKEVFIGSDKIIQTAPV